MQEIQFKKHNYLSEPAYNSVMYVSCDSLTNIYLNEIQNYVLQQGIYYFK